MKMTAGTTANIPLVILHDAHTKITLYYNCTYFVFFKIVGTGAFLSIFTFATPLLIHWVSKKYVVELVYNKIDDSYTAITYTLLLRKKQVCLTKKV